MRWALFLIVVACPAIAGERVSPPLSVEGATAALAMAGVRGGVSFPIGPYRYQVYKLKTASKGRNAFTVEIELKPLPMRE